MGIRSLGAGVRWIFGHLVGVQGIEFIASGKTLRTLKQGLIVLVNGVLTLNKAAL